MWAQVVLMNSQIFRFHWKHTYFFILMRLEYVSFFIGLMINFVTVVAAICIWVTCAFQIEGDKLNLNRKWVNGILFWIGLYEALMRAKLPSLYKNCTRSRSIVRRNMNSLYCSYNTPTWPTCLQDQPDQHACKIKQKLPLDSLKFCIHFSHI